ASRERLIFNAAVIFLSLNALNLLPLYPFDGGRFMSELLFIRNKYFELIFKILAVSAFIIGAVKLQDFILGVIGTGLLLSVSTSYKLGALSEEIKEKLDRKFEGRLLDQKNQVLNVNISGLLGRFHDPRGERIYQNLADDLWDRLKYIPPGLSETIMLSLGYFIPWLMVISFVIYGSLQN
ncbi:MAG TPA: hypothetical protein VMT35_09890, partial [Ignavibacteriaceae bacterium]|nr:hypothetical protein [Ignavibacteriaceae bacterium]